jgi:hypothetical protein
MLHEGQRFALLDRHGRRIEDWQVQAVHQAPGVRTRATLVDPANPATSMDIAAAELRDRRKFRPVPAVDGTPRTPAHAA